MWLLILANILNIVRVSKCDILSEVVCERSEDGYLVPDPYQCDRFAECTPYGDLKIELCTDGHALDLTTGVCDLYSKVDCTGREQLQNPTGTGLCPRLNGNFPVPVEVSCSEYVDCRDGQPFMQNCGHGAVFDELLGCVHPDETSRVGCRAEDVFGFKCPEFGDSKRFGDHERLAHPEDCSLFYACLSTGQPRLLGCEKPKVFDAESGLCKKQELVPGCENWYPPEEVEDKIDLDAERKRIADEIKAELEAKFGLRTGILSEDTAQVQPPPVEQTTNEGSKRQRIDGFAGLRRPRPRIQTPPAVEINSEDRADPHAHTAQASISEGSSSAASSKRNSLFARPRHRDF